MSKSQIPIKTPEEMGGKMNAENGSPKIDKKVMHKNDILDENSGQGRNSLKPSRIDMDQMLENRDVDSSIPFRGPILLIDIHPNDWNPNQMSIEEHIELFKEIKHLGHVPKPIVLRRTGTGYEIVDGEQSYQTLKDLGWKELQPGQYELIEADDFEAMRQTYKRNQHGTHDKLKEGLLFKRLMDERKLSQRELAKQVDISEGTIRNALEYVKALEVRNNYADWDLDSYKKKIANLTVRDVRLLNEMPVEMGDLWLVSGAKTEDLPDPDEDKFYDPKLAALIPLLGMKTCNTAIDQLCEIGKALRLWGYYLPVWSNHRRRRERAGGLLLAAEEAIPYLQHYLQSRWFEKTNKYIADSMHDMLEAISRPDGDKAKIVLPLDTFQAWIDYPDPMSLYDFKEKLKIATAEIEAPINGTDLWRDQLQKYAPDEIKNSKLPVEQAYKLWQTFKASVAEGVKKEILDQALARAILSIEPKSNPIDVFTNIVQELVGDVRIEEEITSLGDKTAMLAQINELFSNDLKVNAFFAGLSQDPNKMSRLDQLKKTMELMQARLSTLQEPELALILALITKKNWFKIWATAIGWKFESSVENKEAEKKGSKSARGSRVKH